MGANKNKGKLLGIDWGGKKTGLAICDAMQCIARDIKTIPTGQLIIEINKFKQQENIIGLVLGLPVKLNGEENKACEAMRQVASDIQIQVDLPVYFQEEKLTSWDAREKLEEMGYSKKKIQELEDQVAAKLILQSYLDNPNRVGK